MLTLNNSRQPLARCIIAPQVKQVLPKASSNLYSTTGSESLAHIQQKWEYYKSQVPGVSGFVDENSDYLRQQVMDFQGTGLVASHNDICNANWLISPEGALYLIDFRIHVAG